MKYGKLKLVEKIKKPYGKRQINHIFGIFICEIYKISYFTIQARVRYGWAMMSAITTPIIGCGNYFTGTRTHPASR